MSVAATHGATHRLNDGHEIPAIGFGTYPLRGAAGTEAIRSTRESLDRLGLDRLDLHLIHWPNPGRGRYVEAWRALVDLQRDGLVRSIGVSNFTAEHCVRSWPRPG